MIGRVALRDWTVLVSLAAIWIFFAVMAPSYMSARNLSSLSVELAITAILALGMLVVILPGQIDLSVGSGVGLMGGIVSVLIFHRHWPAPLAMLPALLAAAAIWFLQGSMIAILRIPAFIITLGGMLVLKGVFWLVIGARSVPVAVGGGSNLFSILTTYYLPSWAAFALTAGALTALVGFFARTRGRRVAAGFPVGDATRAYLTLFIVGQVLLLVVLNLNRFRGVPIALIIFAVIAVGIQVATKHTPFGRYLYAIGGNEEAALVSGIPIQHVIIGAYVLLGIVTAITGFLQTAYAGASTPTVGDLMELDAIAACVIGGTSLRGGRGSVIGVLGGSLMMTSLINGMTLMAVPPEYKMIARGVVLTLAVSFDVLISRRRRAA